jgi:predicted nucleotidyltransferase
MHKEFKVLVGKVFREVKKHYGKNLVSFVIFGSVAKNTFSPCSDIDFLIICENLPGGRAKRIIDFIENVEVKVEDYIKNLRKKNIFTELSPVIKKPDEVKMGSFLFLDMIEDAVILLQ